MTVLTWVISASLLGGALSVLCAAVFALNAGMQRYLGAMVSYDKEIKEAVEFGEANKWTKVKYDTIKY